MPAEMPAVVTATVVTAAANDAKCRHAFRPSPNSLSDVMHQMSEAMASMMAVVVVLLYDDWRHVAWLNAVRLMWGRIIGWRRYRVNNTVNMVVAVMMVVVSENSSLSRQFFSLALRAKNGPIIIFVIFKVKAAVIKISTSWRRVFCQSTNPWCP